MGLTCMVFQRCDVGYCMQLHMWMKFIITRDFLRISYSSKRVNNMNKAAGKFIVRKIFFFLFYLLHISFITFVVILIAFMFKNCFSTCRFELRLKSVQALILLWHTSRFALHFAFYFALQLFALNTVCQ